MDENKYQVIDPDSEKYKLTAKDILDLIKLTQETVKKETGVTLEPEVIILR